MLVSLSSQPMLPAPWLAPRLNPAAEGLRWLGTKKLPPALRENLLKRCCRTRLAGRSDERLSWSLKTLSWGATQCVSHQDCLKEKGVTSKRQRDEALTWAKREPGGLGCGMEPAWELLHFLCSRRGRICVLHAHCRTSFLLACPRCLLCPPPVAFTLA